MKNFYKSILILTSILIFATAHPQDTIRMKIDSIANAYLSDTTNVGLVIGIFRRNANPNVHTPEIYSYGFKSKRTHISTDSITLFKLGSIGKTFTATVLAYYLVHEPNNVRLNRTINSYLTPGTPLPYWVPPIMTTDTFRITLLDLATHHGSLPDQPHNWVPPPNYTVARLFQFLGSNDTSYHVRPLPYQPGTRWNYSNTGFGTLGVILDTITGKQYDSLLIKVFCDTLNMPDTRVFLNSNQLSRLAVGYSNGDSTQFALPTSPAFYGAGGNYSTMRDMMKYLAWNLGFTNTTLNDLLDTLHLQRKIADTTGNPNSTVGLAWQRNHLYPGGFGRYIWKDGGTTGYSTFICFIDSTGTGCVVLSNSTNEADPVGIAVLRVLNPLYPTIGISNITTEIPKTFSLMQNYPNPFNPVTKIRFDLPSNVKSQTSNVKLIIYNALGKEINTLVNENLNAGSYEVEFDAGNLSSGIYFYSMSVAGNLIDTKRMILLK